MYIKYPPKKFRWYNGIKKVYINKEIFGLNTSGKINQVKYHGNCVGLTRKETAIIISILSARSRLSFAGLLISNNKTLKIIPPVIQRATQSAHT